MTGLLLSGAPGFIVPGTMNVAMAQTQKLSGTVVDEFGEPVIGANIRVKGTSDGTITDADGKFSVGAKSGAMLEISFMGYASQTVAAANGMTVTLREDAQSLDDVVVVGYGVQKKKLLTGATAQVKGDDIQKLNATNPLQAMQGQTPGVAITSNSGQPGSEMNVTIRGLGNINGAGPLVLIDGVGGDISTLNPADIESIDVLKDAASAAIYGASAANGVVLITTKGGHDGKSTISFDAYWGWQNVARKANLLNAEQYRVIMDEQQVNSGQNVYDWDNIQAVHNAQGGFNDTDWLDQMFKDNALTSSYSLGITGGNKTSNYALSLAYMNQEGIVGGEDVSNYERWNFRLNSDHQVIKDLLKVGEQVGYVYRTQRGIGVGNQYNNSLRSAFTTSPLTPVYSDNNIYDSPYNDTSNSDWAPGEGNPYGTMMTCNNSETHYADLNSNVYAELTPIKGLKLRTLFGYKYDASDSRSMKDLYQFSIYTFNNTRTEASQSSSNSNSMTWTNTAQYDFKVSDNSFKVLLGMEAYRYQGVYMGATGGYLKSGFDTWETAYISNTSATSNDDGLSAYGAPSTDSRSVSYFGRIGWDWQEKYMVNATLRCDGNSNFAKGNRFGWFPSVSAGWTLSEEDWMQDLKESGLDFLKLRASWGQVGNAAIGAFMYAAPITSSTTNYNFGTTLGSSAYVWGAYPSRLSNEDIKWETSEQTNIGIDARVLDSRLGINLDYYTKKSKDWLVQAPVLATAGADAPYINGGDVKNTGFEFALNWNDKIGQNFRYSVGINGAYNKNEVGKIPTEDGIIHGQTGMLYDNSEEFYRAENGHAIGYFWGYKTAGIFQSQDDIANWIAAGNGVKQTDVQPGDVKYYDVNHDGQIDDEDKVDLGNGMPDFTYGFNISCEWKGFDFSLVANGAAGQQVVQSYGSYSSEKANYTTRILDRWTGEGTSNTIPRVTNTNINWEFSDLYVQDADYLRISNVTIGYDLARLWKSKYCSQCRVYVQAQNLLTFTKYDGMDPEIGTYGTSDSWVSGVDVGYYPRPRTIMVGCNIKF